MKHKTNQFLYSFSFIIILMYSSSILFAQEQQMVIRGTVIDENTKEPVAGATIIEQDKEKRTITGVVSDFDGNFAIKINKKQVVDI